MTRLEAAEAAYADADAVFVAAKIAREAAYQAVRSCINAHYVKPTNTRGRKILASAIKYSEMAHEAAVQVHEKTTVAVSDQYWDVLKPQSVG